MKKGIRWLTTIAIVGLFIYQQYGDQFSNGVTESSEQETDWTNKKDNAYYLPSSTTGALVFHNNYTLSYNESHEQAEWVAYQLKASDLVNTKRKRPYFIADKAVKTKSADWRSYKNSGYDRGHLCPAGDRKMSVDSYNETFLTSNISPQNHEFNAGIWNDLEQQVRSWTKYYKTVYVVTGGVLTDGLETIGHDAVSVPKYFYKIVFRDKGSDSKMIGFIIPNSSSANKPLQQYVVTVDEIEAKTGLDFFPKLEDTLENRLEASSNSKGWRFR